MKSSSANVTALVKGMEMWLLMFILLSPFSCVLKFPNEKLKKKMKIAMFMNNFKKLFKN